MSSDGLRARWKRRRAAPTTRVELGAASANAYFTSKRLRVVRPHGPQGPAPDDGRIPSKRQRDAKQHDAETEKLARLEWPSPSQILAEVRAVDKHMVPPRGPFERYFSTWKSELLAHFNLLFYGVGSKVALLQDFATTCLRDGFVLSVHGYLPVVSLHFLIQTIYEKILKTDAKQDQSLSQQCRDIGNLPPPPGPPVYLIVHSIDGLALRHAEAQTCLSWLAKAPFIHLIASMDHINGPSIWPEEAVLRFEWLSQNLDTCQPYTNEIELRLAKRAKLADVTSSGVKFIMQSLTPTDVATLQEVARQQVALSEPGTLQRRKRKDMDFALYQSVYEACRKKLLHATPLAMKNSVKCLEDHGLLKKGRHRAVEYLKIPLSESIIKTDILHQEDS